MPTNIAGPDANGTLYATTAGAPAPFSLTYDQGKEMAKHENLARTTGTRIFFADPHSKRVQQETPQPGVQPLHVAADFIAQFI